MPVTVKAITDGPLMVKGEFEVEDGQGNAIPGKGGDTIFLCRCGSSANKPFCDGTHKRISFKGCRSHSSSPSPLLGRGQGEGWSTRVLTAPRSRRRRRPPAR